MVKICAGAENWASAEILTSRAGTTGRYSTGETLPIKAERPEPSDHLRSTCTRINTIYEDLNESSSARLGGSQQLEILPNPNSKRAPEFSAWILIGAEILEAVPWVRWKEDQVRLDCSPHPLRWPCVSDSLATTSKARAATRRTMTRLHNAELVN